MNTSSPKVTWGNRQKKKTWTDYFAYVHRGIAKHLTRYIE